MTRPAHHTAVIDGILCHAWLTPYPSRDPRGRYQPRQLGRLEAHCPSSTEPGTFHIVVIRRDHKWRSVTCPCKSWHYRQTCAHVTRALGITTSRTKFVKETTG